MITFSRTRRMAVLLCMATFSFAAVAQDYPSKAVIIIAPSGPGGGFDFVGRVVAERLTRKFGKSFIVENKAGSGTLVGTQAAASATPDGYTLMVGSLSNMAFNSALYKSLPYNPQADFTTLGLVAQYPYLMVARGDLPQNNYKDLLQAIKANPEQMTIATVGTGSGQQVLAAAFMKATNTKLLTVPYKSAQAAYQDLLAGRVDLFIDTLPSIRPHIESKRAKAIFSTSPTRNSSMPNIPTAKEVGLPGLEMGAWFGIFAPSKTPAPIVDSLRKALVGVSQDKEFQVRLETAGIEVMHLSVPASDAFMKSEYDKWTAVIKQAGIVAD